MITMITWYLWKTNTMEENPISENLSQIIIREYASSSLISKIYDYSYCHILQMFPKTYKLILKVSAGEVYFIRVQIIFELVHGQKKYITHPLNNQCSWTNRDPLQNLHWKKKQLKKSMGLNLRFFHLTSTATPIEYMNFSRNGNERSSIESKNKGIGH
jgi:hypothetical protein